MEEAIKTTPAILEQQLNELVPLQVIRTETVLSKLPIHNLAKKGNVDINIIRRNQGGEVELKWIVSYNERYGQPRQVGYKLDTIVINRRIDEAGRPVPELIRLGSLREIASELDQGGNNTSAIRQALLQNASAFITARLQYTGNDKRQRTLEAGFTRYSVIFTGERLPGGEKADAVYIELSKRYREVLTNAIFRPLNYDYMRELSPAAQRFYEVVSRAMFAALKYQHGEAKLAYSEYCTCSAQIRYYDYNRFKKQMYKIHRPHIASGYIKAVRFEVAKDGEGKTDWTMYYAPGPKARAEFNTFVRSGRVIDSVPELVPDDVAIAKPPAKPRASSRQKRFSFAPATSPIEDSSPLLAEITKRGIGEGKARELLAGGVDPEHLIDQLEWGDHQIRHAKSGEIRNPAGFYIHLIEEKISPPPTFETNRRRHARETAQAAKERESMLKAEREEAYQDFRTTTVSKHIERHILPEELDMRIASMVVKARAQYKNLPAKTLQEIAARDVRFAIANELNLPTFEDFCAKLASGETIQSS